MGHCGSVVIPANLVFLIPESLPAETPLPKGSKPLQISD